MKATDSFDRPNLVLAKIQSGNGRVVIVTKQRPSVYENRRLRKAMKHRGVDVEFCNPDLFAITMGANPVLTYDGKIFIIPDFILTRTGSGTGSHAATILRSMMAMGMLVVNSLPAIQAAMDKIYTHQVAAAAGLPIPRTMVHSGREGLVAGWTGGYPCIVKLATGSHGLGVFKCDSPGQLKAIVDMITTLDRKRPFLIQEYLGDRPGCDLRVFVIGGKAVGAMMRSAKDGDFRAGITAGGSGASFDLTPEITEISEKIARLMRLEIAGVDLLFKDNNPVLCEINSAPGFKGFETYCCVDIAGKIAEYVVKQLRPRLSKQVGEAP